MDSLQARTLDTLHAATTTERNELMSRSRLRREAVQRGEEMPTFVERTEATRLANMNDPEHRHTVPYRSIADERPDKPFHKAECQCQQCREWEEANPRERNS